MIKFVECPRDAMQGIKNFIPTEVKANFINKLLKVGFDTLDFGSFVSPKAIPQMRDTAQVLEQLDLSGNTKLSAIVANKRGAIDALQFEEIAFLGFPFSISQTFQLRNTNSTIEESLERVHDIQDLCVANDRKLITYISMGFGNPYGDPWNAEIVMQWVEKIIAMDIGVLAISDTVGVASPESIEYLFKSLTQAFPNIEFGAHLHTRKDNWRSKVKAAYENGCYRFDSALQGFGGCPMAKDELVGNMPTELMLTYFEEIQEKTGIDYNALREALDYSSLVFQSEH